LVVTYKDQIENFAELAKKYDLKEDAPKHRYTSKTKSDSSADKDNVSLSSSID
jgi:hypothetical protein